MIWILGALSLAVVLLLIALLRYAHKRLINLQAYTAFVLLNDDMQQDHQAKLKDYIATVRPETDRADALTERTLKAVQHLADRLAQKGFLLGVHAKIWNLDQEEDSVPSSRSGPL